MVALVEYIYIVYLYIFGDIVIMEHAVELS